MHNLALRGAASIRTYLEDAGRKFASYKLLTSGAAPSVMWGRYLWWLITERLPDGCVWFVRDQIKRQGESFK